MKKLSKFLILIFLVSSHGLNLYSQNKEKDSSILSVSEMKMADSQYPWNSEITTLAIEAINQSINNLKLTKKKRPKNFPNSPGSYNVPFNQNEIVEFEIIGYSYSEEKPNIYDIEFRPKDEFGSGNRITVKVNIKTKQALMVYMQADA